MEVFESRQSIHTSKENTRKMHAGLIRGSHPRPEFGIVGFPSSSLCFSSHKIKKAKPPPPTTTTTANTNKLTAKENDSQNQ
jgi:hypothetical protein